ncbi:MAG: DUF3341 domain-containing protein [Chloroflexi bacterium]|nr:DUF3341 domain-containing protein [Chloroflexota bacterium]
MTSLPRTVYGAFPDRTLAERALDDFRSHNFRREDISFVTGAREEDLREVRGLDTRAEEGTGYGIAAGGALGAVLGWLAGVGLGTIAIPGLGGLLVAGPLLTALSGLALGSAAGGIVGALVGIGMPEDEALAAERYLRDGRPVVIVRAGDRADEAVSILAAHGALNVPPPPAGYRAPAEQPRP